MVHIGHSLFSVFVGLQRWKKNLPDDFWKILCFFIVLGLVPDIDFLPGLLIGSINKYHHGVTHSIGFAFVFSIIFGYFYYLWKKDNNPLSYLAIFLVWFGHAILDFVSIDTSIPYGMPVLWPFSDKYFISPWVVFSDVDRGSFSRMFGGHNQRTFLVEVLIMGPVVWLAWVQAKNTKKGKNKKRYFIQGLVFVFFFIAIVLSLHKTVINGADISFVPLIKW